MARNLTIIPTNTRIVYWRLRSPRVARRGRAAVLGGGDLGPLLPTHPEPLWGDRQPPHRLGIAYIGIWLVRPPPRALCSQGPLRRGLDGTYRRTPPHRPPLYPPSQGRPHPTHPTLTFSVAYVDDRVEFVLVGSDPVRVRSPL